MRALLTNIDPAEFDAIVDELETKAVGKFCYRPRPMLDPTVEHLVYARKVFFDKDDETKFIALILAEEFR